MTPSPSEEAKKLVEDLKSLEKEKEAISRRKKEIFWEEAKRFYKLKEENLYLHEDKNWKSFLQKIDVPLHTAEFKASIYGKWIEELGYSPEDLIGTHTRKLHRAISYVETKKKAEVVLDKARDLTTKDFIRWLKEDLEISVKLRYSLEVALLLISSCTTIAFLKR